MKNAKKHKEVLINKAVQILKGGKELVYSTCSILKEENEEIEKNDKDIFIAELLDSIEPYKENMLYDDMANTEGKIVDDIFNLLMDKQEITKEDLLNIFAKNNSYIVSTDDEKISKNLENNIMQIVRAVNTAFK